MGRKRNYRPPARLCEECGLTFRAWSGIYCPGCRGLMMQETRGVFGRVAKRAEKIAELEAEKAPEWK